MTPKVIASFVIAAILFITGLAASYFAAAENAFGLAAFAAFAVALGFIFQAFCYMRD